MNTELKEIIIAYFHGGCATGDNNKKSHLEIEQDLKTIHSFFQGLDTE